MSDLWRKRQYVSVAALVLSYWLTAFALPFIVFDPRIKPGAGGWCLIAAVIGYGVYTGLRAFDRGVKGRFILRIVIPAVLFAVALGTVATIRML